ncbi:hypothetical protein PybrP1_002170 [[Pythium] brassicae (nom. inval.)]|nr:hypothetical protein PybrP1_002170 [[Pythium] brassicae (nom. inval.)]
MFQYMLHENAMEMQATAQTKDMILRRYATAQALSATDQDRLQQLKNCEQILADWCDVLDAKLKQFTLGEPRVLEEPDRFAQGFLLNRPVPPKPVNALLVLASRVFLLGYVLFSVIFLYVFLVAFVVLTRHGARFLRFRMDRMQPRLMSLSTMVVVSLVIINLASIELFSTLTLTPQTATFGLQAFVDATTDRVMPHRRMT